MSTYVKTAILSNSRLFEALGAKYYDERSGQKIEEGTATIACRVVFPELAKTNSHEPMPDKSSSSPPRVYISSVGNSSINDHDFRVIGHYMMCDSSGLQLSYPCNFL
jgi:hypothetical protein